MLDDDHGSQTALATTGLGDDQLLAVARSAEQRVEAIKKIKSLALRVTNPQDWIDMGGKPYLQVSGGEKIARLFGISWRLDEPIREDHEDGHYTFTFKGYFSMGTAEIEVVGTRSSKDDFFAVKWQGSGEDRVKVQIPPNEIDRNDVKKAAMTNAIGNGITRLLGIRNLTWEDVKAGGVETSKSGKVQYDTKEKKALTAFPNHDDYGSVKNKAFADCTIQDLEIIGVKLEKWTHDPGKEKFHGYYNRLLNIVRDTLASKEA